MKILNIIVLLGSVYILSSCNDKYLDLAPVDKISDQNFWKTASDLELYANQFYVDLSRASGYLWTQERFTDNQGYKTRDAYLWGESTIPSSGGGWAKADWLKIRNVNYALARIAKMEKSADISRCEGEIRFFKSYYYFDKLVTFGEVPWLDKDLNVDDSLLYKGRDSRETVVSNMVSDLDFAIANLPEVSASGRLTKYAALAFKVNVCLFEGTFRKYHGLGNDYEALIKQAADAAETIINSGLFALYSTGNPEEDYYNLFVQYDYTSNPEAIMFVKYIKDVLMQNEVRYLGETTSGYTKDFVESYLCTDGLPISLSPLYKGDKIFEEEFANRDPRMRQSIHTAERKYRIYPDGSFDMKIPPQFDGTKCWTGYEMIKRYSNLEADRISQQSTLDQFIFRYGKVLIDYAEAKAELGECTQEVLDKSLNLLRDRVGMPHLKVEVGFVDPNWPNWEVPVSPLINEIRRERRIEITMEGYDRWYDLLRWKAGKLLENEKTQLGAYDPTTGNYHEIWPGFIRKWNDKLYLHPIPTQELTLNSNMKQNPGWE